MQIYTWFWFMVSPPPHKHTEEEGENKQQQFCLSVYRDERLHFPKTDDKKTSGFLVDNSSISQNPGFN